MNSQADVIGRMTPETFCPSSIFVQMIKSLDKSEPCNAERYCGKATNLQTMRKMNHTESESTKIQS